MSCRWLLVAVSSLGGSAALAHSVAVLPAAPSGQVPRKVLRGVDDAIAELLPSTSGVETLHGAELRKRVRDVRATSRGCGEETACLAKLGRRAKVDEVVLIRVRVRGKGLRLTFMVAGSDDRRLRRTVSINIDSLEMTGSSVGTRLGEIFAVSREESGEEEELALAPMPPLEALPVAEPVAEPIAEPLVEPSITELPLPPVDPPPEEVVVTPPLEPPEQSDWMFYGGVGLIGAGVAAGAAATYFGLQYLSASAEIDADVDRELTQVRTKQIGQDGERAGAIGTGVGLAAGVLAAAGATLLLVDLVGQEVSVEVNVQEARTGASVTFPW